MTSPELLELELLELELLMPELTTWPALRNAATNTPSPPVRGFSNESGSDVANATGNSEAANLARTVVELQRQLTQMSQLALRGVQEVLQTMAQFNQNQAATMDQMNNVIGQIAALGTSARGRAQSGGVRG